MVTLALLPIGIWIWSQVPDWTSSQRLASLPEAQLRYPDAELLGNVGTNRSDGFFGKGATSASWGMILGSHASMQEILAFYDSQLMANDWAGSPTGTTTEEIAAYQWVRGDLRFRLGFTDPEALRERKPASNRWATIFRLRIIERDRD